MNTTLLPKHRPVGAKPMYAGGKTVAQSVYWPPSLHAELLHEVATRNRRAGTEAWTLSNLVVAIVAKELGVELPKPQ